jgi:hypothetical protein
VFMMFSCGSFEINITPKSEIGASNRPQDLR